MMLRYAPLSSVIFQSSNLSSSVESEPCALSPLKATGSEAEEHQNQPGISHIKRDQTLIKHQNVMLMADWYGMSKYHPHNTNSYNTKHPPTSPTSRSIGGK